MKTMLKIGRRAETTALAVIGAAAAAAVLATPALAGADATFNTALNAFTGFLEGSGGKIITVLSLAGGVVGLASGRFSLGQVAIPVGVGVGAGDPELIGFWTLDEFLAMVIPFTWGILSQHIVIGIGLAVLGWWALRRAKAGRATSWLIHLAYWHLPGGFPSLKATPPSYLRLMVG